ncbi:hypothetical protein HPB48_016558 [Haemaphysalis longicornis]|uniref:Methyltransferase type 11 domain-containing protein n=1 Tax=Haemaphysalis longicornis TaxID=44386 RepID=A0A9J6H3F2_HAELO|nr:hypothetical protein HPB48_016558 [Haemaphysalis longicornis]
MERWVHAYGEDMSELQDEQFDVVLLTYLLCSTSDPLKVLKEAKRVLVKVGTSCCSIGVVSRIASVHFNATLSAQNNPWGEFSGT